MRWFWILHSILALCFKCTALYLAFLLSKGNNSVAICCSRYTYKCITACVAYNIIVVNIYKTVIILKFSFTCYWHLKRLAVIKSHSNPKTLHVFETIKKILQVSNFELSWKTIMNIYLNIHIDIHHSYSIFKIWYLFYVLILIGI